MNKNLEIFNYMIADDQLDAHNLINDYNAAYSYLDDENDTDISEFYSNINFNYFI